MSLRVFHIVFISVSVALTLYIAVWGVREFMLSRSTLGISMALLRLPAARRSSGTESAFFTS